MTGSFPTGNIDLLKYLVREPNLLPTPAEVNKTVIKF